VGEPENKRIVGELWSRLYRKDWDGVAACIAPDGHYEDVPAPDAGATGPANVVKRLRIGLEPVQRFEHDVHRVVAEGCCVVVEHTETWHFETGEAVRNHFVTIHEVKDGKISLWRDYWDLNTLMAQAPRWWIERLAKFSPADFA
jgi:limonene-1,2-epoxide hydrolase